MNNCEGCVANFPCHLGVRNKNDCPCGLCIVKPICQDICDELNIYINHEINTKMTD